MEKPGGSNRRTPASREDWWSEDATETLIAAWGYRYVKLNRGNLRQKDWREVAGSVNSRHGDDGRPKTDIQCKNRIDTLKKKYKTEKAKPSPSTWRFFDRLDSLVGSSKKTHPTSAGEKSKSAPTNPHLNPSRSNSTDSSLDDDDEDDSDDEGERWGFVARKHRRVEDSDLSEGAAGGELAKAMMKFGEIYERIESEKQKVLIELEKQKMEMTKEVELQRMKMLMDMQIELQNLKNRKPNPPSGKHHRSKLF